MCVCNGMCHKAEFQKCNGHSLFSSSVNLLGTWCRLVEAETCVVRCGGGVCVCVCNDVCHKAGIHKIKGDSIFSLSMNLLGTWWRLMEAVTCD